MSDLAYVLVAKTRGAFGFNTQPMDRGAAIDYADGWARTGRKATVLRATPVTPGLAPREMLERHESFLTSDVIAEFEPVCTLSSRRDRPGSEQSVSERMESIGSRLAVDAAGFVWWVRKDGTHSVVRTNPDNSSTPMPFTFYRIDGPLSRGDGINADHFIGG